MTPSVALREQTTDITPAVRRAYFAELERIRKRVLRLEREGVRDTLRTLTGARNEIRTILMNAQGYEAVRLPALMAEVDTQMSQLTQRYGDVMRAGLADAHAIGVDSVDNPLAALGAPVTAPAIAPTVLEAASLMSAELVSNVSTQARAAINRELRLASLGVKSPFEAIRAISGVADIRKNPSVFRTAFTRAETIYRTETGRVQSAAFLARYDQIEDDPRIEKRWIWSGIGRANHAALHGTAAVKGRWTTNGVSAEAPRMFGVASEDINCGCSARVALKDDDADVGPMTEKVG